MRTATASVFALLLTGCATTWYHPDNVTEAHFRRDSYECERDAAYIPRTPQSTTRGYYGAVHYSDPTLGWGDVAAQRGMFRRCMKSKGYTSERPQAVETTPVACPGTAVWNGVGCTTR